MTESIYPLLDRALSHPTEFVREVFKPEELWRPSVIPSELNEPPGMRFLLEIGLPNSNVSEIAEIGMAFDGVDAIQSMNKICGGYVCSLHPRFPGMYCLTETSVYVNVHDNGAVYSVSLEPPRVFLVNSSIPLLAVSLAAYVTHARFKLTLNRREDYWHWNEKFFQFLSVLDPPVYGKGETYWSRVEEFLGFE